MAKLMTNGDSVSKVFRPQAPFGIVARPASGSITGNWRVQVSADNVNWYDSDTTNLIDGYQEVFSIPIGFYCRIHGGSGTNLEIDGNYLGGYNNIGDLAGDFI